MSEAMDKTLLCMGGIWLPGVAANNAGGDVAVTSL